MPRRNYYATELDNEINSRQIDISTYKFTTAIVLGVGGIGSWVALDMALSGTINSIHIVDPDIVEATNLNRTPFRLCDIGSPKVTAMKYIILERRAINVVCYQQKTNKEFANQMYLNFAAPVDTKSKTRLIDTTVIVDCRDDAIDDCYELPFKYYKVGYDGLSCTIDGNPRNTSVWGRANTYRFTPSFICPAQLVANLVVTDILTDKLTEEDKKDWPILDSTTNSNVFDVRGRINKAFTFDVRDIIEVMYRESLKNE